DGIEKNTIVNGFSILGGINELNQLEDELALVISVADPKIKINILEKIKNSKINYPVIIHPNASISDDDVVVGEGTVICEGTIITCNIKIGRFVVLNLMCTVGHDTIIDDYCAFMPAVNISGEVHIHQGVYVGTGAKIINLLEIGEKTIIGAGAVVSKSLPAKCTAVGIPAKPIKFHE